jgi:beta-lactamase superfamily II metal-dependent hydrolase
VNGNNGGGTQMYIEKHIMKKIIVTALCASLLLGILPCMDSVYAADEKNMRIHAIFQGIHDGGAGDAVLVESDGTFLLMDTGAKSHDKTLNYLKNLVGIDSKQKPLSIYISHYHVDHVGAIKAICKKFKIDKFYLPDKSLIKAGYDDKSDTKGDLKKYYDICESQAKTEDKANGGNGAGGNIVWLVSGSNFSFGDVKVEILAETGKTKYGGKDKAHPYFNNNSLATLMTCGTTKFLTCGDLQKEGENRLIGTAKAIIMKLHHHGLRYMDKNGKVKEATSANFKNVFKTVKPKITFVQSKGDIKPTEKDEEGGSKKYMRPYNSMKYAREYGLCFSTTHEKKNFIIDVNNNKIKMYATTSPVEILDEAKHRLSGVTKIIEYFKKPGRKGREDIKYYIDPQKGYRTKNNSKLVTTPKGKLIYVRANGSMLVDKLKKAEKYSYYFNANGYALKSKWKKIKSGKTTYKYYFNEKGHMVKGKNEIGKYTYYFAKSSGFMYKSKWKNIKTGNYKYSYYFNKKGHMVTGKKKIDGETFYFDKDGKLLTKKGGKPLKIK